MHWSRGWSCTDYLADHALITWLIMHWSRSYHALDGSFVEISVDRGQASCERQTSFCNVKIILSQSTSHTPWWCSLARQVLTFSPAEPLTFRGPFHSVWIKPIICNTREWVLALQPEHNTHPNPAGDIYVFKWSTAPACKVSEFRQITNDMSTDQASGWWWGWGDTPFHHTSLTWLSCCKSITSLRFKKLEQLQKDI